MLQIRGSQANSDFRITKLYDDLKKHFPQITGLNSEYQHFIDTSETLTKEQQTVLENLLTYGPVVPEVPHSGELILVLPRLGTISPWSTKATDIAHHCGLTQIKRIERGVAWYIQSQEKLDESSCMEIASYLHDPMTESVVYKEAEAVKLFDELVPQALVEVDILANGKQALVEANIEMGLALSEDEIDYLIEQYQRIQKNPTDVELMMFAQVNSEHCRHKIFNADWVVDGENKDHSLFRMIRETHMQNSKGTLVAYSDNSSVLEGSKSERFYVNSENREYVSNDEAVHILCKVETHNHPTAISPFPGAATGSGGEIRDEGATGRGSKPKAGLTGFSVSNLRIPDALQPWEGEEQKPARIASPLQIMLEGPIGGRIVQ